MIATHKDLSRTFFVALGPAPSTYRCDHGFEVQQSTAGGAMRAAISPTILRQRRLWDRVLEERSFPPGIVDQIVPKYLAGTVG